MFRLGVLIGGLVALVGCSPSYPPDDLALGAMASGSGVEVEVGEWITFTPEEPIPGAAFIFYPGGKVEPEAYAPPVRKVAEGGYLSIIVPMPLDLGILGLNRADDVLEAYPDIHRWIIAGHSLGGTAASTWAGRNPDIVDGLGLWGSYPREGDGLPGSGIDVAMVYGSEDCLATVEEVEAAAEYVPEDGRWILIEGGNHAHFGSYGPQEGDCDATIPKGVQHDIAAGSVIEMFERLRG